MFPFAPASILDLFGTMVTHHSDGNHCKWLPLLETKARNRRND